jgi:hypothetical protein
MLVCSCCCFALKKNAQGGYVVVVYSFIPLGNMPMHDGITSML